LGGHLQHNTSNQSPGPTKSHGFNTIFCITGSEINKKQNPKYWQKLKLLTTANSGSNPVNMSDGRAQTMVVDGGEMDGVAEGSAARGSRAGAR
jgi:archaellin